MVLDQVISGGQPIPLFGSGADAGNLALYNPIAREDLGRFIVSCINNENSYGRILPVGGPWSADNVCTLRDTAEWMLADASPPGKKPSHISGIGMKFSVILYELLEKLGYLSKITKKLATIIFFYTKYWATVSHFVPGTGVYDTKAYTKELCDAALKDPKAFHEWVMKQRSATTASTVYPYLPRNSWWDISKPSLSPEQIPMGAGKPVVSHDLHAVPAKLGAESVLDEAAATAKCLDQLHAMFPTAPLRIGQVTEAMAEESDSEWIITDGGSSD